MQSDQNTSDDHSNQGSTNPSDESPFQPDSGHSIIDDVNTDDLIWIFAVVAGVVIVIAIISMVIIHHIYKPDDEELLAIVRESVSDSKSRETQPNDEPKSVKTKPQDQAKP